MVGWMTDLTPSTSLSSLRTLLGARGPLILTIPAHLMEK
jgi:hypothetical protein